MPSDEPEYVQIEIAIRLAARAAPNEHQRSADDGGCFHAGDKSISWADKRRHRPVIERDSPGGMISAAAVPSSALAASSAKDPAATFMRRRSAASPGCILGFTTAYLCVGEYAATGSSNPSKPDGLHTYVQRIIDPGFYGPRVRELRAPRCAGIRMIRDVIREGR